MRRYAELGSDVRNAVFLAPTELTQPRLSGPVASAEPARPEPPHRTLVTSAEVSRTGRSDGIIVPKSESFAGGIPIAIFGDVPAEADPPRWNVTYGKSGNPFEYSVGPDFVDIVSLADDQVGFSMSVTGGRVTSDVNNRTGTGERDPDIDPTALHAVTLQHFREYGHDVHTLEAEWLQPLDGEGSYNWYSYFGNLGGRLEHEVTDADRREAAARTWGGRLAANLGFTEVASVREAWRHTKGDDEFVARDIIVEFVKP